MRTPYAVSIAELSMWSSVMLVLMSTAPVYGQQTVRRSLQSELDTPGRSFALFILKNRKFQKHLYERYGGGRILWQQVGLEAFDGHRVWLETLEKRAEFQIPDPELRSTFYGYWTTMEHRLFLIGDKGRIERGFLEPEWLRAP